VRVALTARFRIELPEKSAASSLALLDADGNELAIVTERAGARSYYERVPAQIASALICTADDRATTLVIYGADGEIHRMPIQLTPDDLTVFRP